MTDPESLRQVAQQCQSAARAMGDLQNRASLLAISPQDAAQMAAVLRATRGPIHLTEVEKRVVLDLLSAAGMSAIMLPDNHPTALSVTGLVTTLLNAGNLLEQHARDRDRARPEPAKETV